ALVLLATAADAPITRVTVHPDRARIERTLRLELRGTESVELPLLPASVDPASIRIEATGAEVLAVEIHSAGPAEVPAPEARRLLRSLDEGEAQLAAAGPGQEAADEQRGKAEGGRPAPPGPPQRPH